MLETVSNLGVENGLRKVLAELQGFKVNLAAGANANTAISVAGIEIEDTIAGVINLTDGSEVDLTHCSIVDRRATGTLTIDPALADGDAVDVNGKTYTFTELTETIATNVGPQVCPIEVGASGVDVDVVAARLAKVIMSADSSLTCTTSDNGVVNIFAREAGTGGNAITLDVTDANAHVTRSGATLAGGTASTGIKCSDSTATKKLLVFWFNKQ